MQTYVTREQDYALRITAALAGLKKNEQLPVSQLSKKLFISKNFAARIVLKLKQAGILGTTQGKYGGVFLRKDAKKLSVLEVLTAIGFKTKFNQCLDDEQNCMLIEYCKFHTLFAEEEDRLHKRLKKRTISEFIYK